LVAQPGQKEDGKRQRYEMTIYFHVLTGH
jgi:hypothetical protein